jgi:hypothetical protein
VAGSETAPRVHQPYIMDVNHGILSGIQFFAFSSNILVIELINHMPNKGRRACVDKIKVGLYIQFVYLITNLVFPRVSAYISDGVQLPGNLASFEHLYGNMNCFFTLVVYRVSLVVLADFAYCIPYALFRVMYDTALYMLTFAENIWVSDLTT